jgi:hypothetical protein
MINTDVRLLLYHCLQFGYHKHVRTSYRINVNQLSILTAIYYATQINPKRWKGSVKQCIKTLNPQLNGHYILRDLDILDSRGLITYNERHPKDYKIKLTSEGKQVISSLFDPEAIDSFIEANRDKY